MRFTKDILNANNKIIGKRKPTVRNPLFTTCSCSLKTFIISRYLAVTNVEFSWRLQFHISLWRRMSLYGYKMKCEPEIEFFVGLPCCLLIPEGAKIPKYKLPSTRFFTSSPDTELTTSSIVIDIFYF